jgi:hypothetical protein
MAFAMLELIHWRQCQAFVAVDDGDFDGVDGHWDQRHKMWPDSLLACFRMIIMLYFTNVIYFFLLVPSVYILQNIKIVVTNQRIAEAGFF